VLEGLRDFFDRYHFVGFFIFGSYYGAVGTSAHYLYYFVLRLDFKLAVFLEIFLS
jgi:hypothetical protein